MWENKKGRILMLTHKTFIYREGKLTSGLMTGKRQNLSPEHKGKRQTGCAINVQTHHSSSQ